MAYYAPFYRPTYYDQVQNPNMGQFNQQFQQPMPQQLQPTQMSAANSVSSDFLWVLNENEATSYPVAPNNTVTLWDKNLPTIYIKSVNAQGVPSMRVLDFTERTTSPSKMPENHVCQCGDRFVSLDAFNALQAKLDALESKVDGLNTKATARSKKTEEAESE